MLQNKQVAYGLIAAGLVVALLSVLIDPLRGHHIFMADMQVLALVAGIVAMGVGAYLLLKQNLIALSLLELGLQAVWVAVVVDPLRGHDVYLGTEQIILLVAGVIAALVGAYLGFVRRQPVAA